MNNPQLAPEGLEAATRAAMEALGYQHGNIVNVSGHILDIASIVERAITAYFGSTGAMAPEPQGGRGEDLDAALLVPAETFSQIENFIAVTADIIHPERSHSPALHNDNSRAQAAYAIIDSAINRASRLRAALSATPPVAREHRAEWHPMADIPNVDPCHSKYFIIAVRRADTGKVNSFPAQYLNAYSLIYEDGCCGGKDGAACPDDGSHEDGCPTTGWFYESSEGEYDSNYTHVYLGPGDEIVGWTDVPAFSTRAALDAGART